MSDRMFDFSEANDEVCCFLDEEYSAVMVKVVSAVRGSG
jgi:hypothetical protein